MDACGISVLMGICITVTSHMRRDGNPTTCSTSYGLTNGKAPRSPHMGHVMWKRSHVKTSLCWEINDRDISKVHGCWCPVAHSSRTRLPPIRQQRLCSPTQSCGLPIPLLHTWARKKGSGHKVRYDADNSREMLGDFCAWWRYMLFDIWGRVTDIFITELGHHWFG